MNRRISPEAFAVAAALVLGPIAGCSPRPAPVPPAQPSAEPASDASGAPGPTVFAPGVISSSDSDLSPTFTPDGHTVYYGRRHAIVVSRRQGQRWSDPEVAEFSGRWGDLEPALSPDGSFLVFASNRPAVESGVVLDGDWGSPTHTVHKRRGGNLWRIDRRGEGWGPAVRLPDSINRGNAVFAPAVVADGSLYFMDAHLPGPFRLYRSQYRDGSYQEPEPVSFSDGTWADVDPTVAPDESFMVFASNRPPAPATSHDLFIVFRIHGAWGEIVHLGPVINDAAADETEPRLGPDHHTLYFASDRTNPASFPRARSWTQGELGHERAWANGLLNIWRIDLAPWLVTRPAGGSTG
jgi:Tol biopolymer transport system component